jgi:hypothetical protein
VGCGARSQTRSAHLPSGPLLLWQTGQEAPEQAWGLKGDGHREARALLYALPLPCLSLLSGGSGRGHHPAVGQNSLSLVGCRGGCRGLPGSLLALGRPFQSSLLPLATSSLPVGGDWDGQRAPISHAYLTSFHLSQQCCKLRAVDAPVVWLRKLRLRICSSPSPLCNQHLNEIIQLQRQGLTLNWTLSPLCYPLPQPLHQIHRNRELLGSLRASGAHVILPSSP